MGDRRGEGPDLEPLRRALYSRPGDSAVGDYLAALATARAAEVEAEENRRRVDVRRRRRSLVLGFTLAGVAAVALSSVLLVTQIERAEQMRDLLVKAERAPAYPGCAIVRPDPVLVRRALGVDKPTINDLAWLRGSVLANTYALRLPDRAGIRGVSSTSEQIPLRGLGALRSGEAVRVSVVAEHGGVGFSVLSADAEPGGNCGSSAPGVAATAVIRLRGRPPFTVLVSTSEASRYAYYCEVPVYANSS